MSLAGYRIGLQAFIDLLDDDLWLENDEIVPDCNLFDLTDDEKKLCEAFKSKIEQIVQESRTLLQEARQ